jgi:hypothetical protein
MRLFTATFITMLAATALGGCQRGEMSILTLKRDHKVGDFVPNEQIWRWLREGSVLCYDHDATSDTCTLVEYPNTFNKAEGTIQQIEMSRNSSGRSLKVVAKQRLRLTPDGICWTFSKEYIDSHQFFAAADDAAKTGSDDLEITGPQVTVFLDIWKQRRSSALGYQSCHRYVATKVDRNGDVIEVQERRYSKGVYQKRAHEPTIIFVTPASQLGLRIGDPKHGAMRSRGF